MTTRRLAVIALLGAITVIMGITPIGIIAVPFLPAKVTIMHLPVIIGALAEGPMVGAGIGLIFGLFSLVQSYTAPTSPLSVLFQNPMISLAPRVLIGLISGGVFWLMKPLRRKNTRRGYILSYGVSAGIGSFVNTAGVLSLMALIYLQATADALGTTSDLVIGVLMGVVATNGVPECLAAVLVSTPILMALNYGRERKGKPL